MQPTTVLLVDDDADSVGMCAVGLDALGFDTLTATTAADAFAEACVSQPEAIVVDLGPPEVCGFHLVRSLRNELLTANAAILVLSGFVQEPVREQATEAGCDRFLGKPCAPEVLATEIRLAVDARAHRHADFSRTVATLD